MHTPCNSYLNCCSHNLEGGGSESKTVLSCTRSPHQHLKMCGSISRVIALEMLPRCRPVPCAESELNASLPAGFEKLRVNSDCPKNKCCPVKLVQKVGLQTCWQQTRHHDAKQLPMLDMCSRTFVVKVHGHITMACILVVSKLPLLVCIHTAFFS